MKIKRYITIVLLGVMLMACAPKVATDPSKKQGITADQVLAGAKTVGKVAAASITEGIALEATLAANGTIDANIEPQIRQWLQDGNKATADFNVRIAKYDHLDADSRKVIADFLNEALGFISNLNDNGLLKIKNPNSQRVASGILAGVRIAITIYKLTVFDKVQ